MPSTSAKQPAPVTWGPTSTIGVVLSLIGIVGTVVAAVKANDAATVTAGGATALAAVSTLGGRFAQAVALARAVARDAGPWIDAGQKALEEPPVKP